MTEKELFTDLMKSEGFTFEQQKEIFDLVEQSGYEIEKMIVDFGRLGAKVVIRKLIKKLIKKAKAL